jgi:hypothetical protein
MIKSKSTTKYLVSSLIVIFVVIFGIAFANNGGVSSILVPTVNNSVPSSSYDLTPPNPTPSTITPTIINSVPSSSYDLTPPNPTPSTITPTIINSVPSSGSTLSPSSSVESYTDTTVTPTVSQLVGITPSTPTAPTITDTTVTPTVSQLVGLTSPPIDTTAPTVALTPDRAPDFGVYYNHLVTFTVTGDDGSGSGIDFCDSPINYSGPDGNSVSVTGYCTDNSSNVGDGTLNFKYDSTKPNTQIIGAVDSKGKSIPNGSKTTSKSVTLSFTGIDNLGISSFQCKLDAGAYSTCTSPITYNNLKQGKTHTFNVRAIDVAGNIDATPAIWSWK